VGGPLMGTRLPAVPAYAAHRRRAVGSGQRRGRRPSLPGRRPTVLAGVGGGGAAPEDVEVLPGSESTSPVGLSRTIADSLAQRSGAAWPSGRFSRPATSTGTTVFQWSEPGARRSQSASQETSLLLLSLLGTVTTTCRRSSSPGKGCSSPPVTT